MSETLLSFRGTVYPWHCDHMGHMNVMWYIGRFDEATWNFLAEFGLSNSAFESHGIGMAALEQNIRYFKELHAGAQIEVYSKLLTVTEKVIEFEHRMVNRESGETCAEVKNTAICLDRVERRGTKFPREIYIALNAALENMGAAGHA